MRLLRLFLTACVLGAGLYAFRSVAPAMESAKDNHNRLAEIVSVE